MFRRLFLLTALLGLAACQSIHLDHDYDPNRDFATLQTWSWQEPAVQYRPDDPRYKSDLTGQRVRASVTQQLEQRNLRQAAPGAPSDFRVQAYLIVDQRQRQTASYFGGDMIADRHGRLWASPGFTEVRTIDYLEGTLQLDFLDRDGTLIWRGSGTQTLPRNPGSPQERASAIHDTVAKILSQFPPRRR